MALLNLETIYPDHVSRIDSDRRVEISFDPKARAARFCVCTFEPRRAEHRKSCWTLREAVDLADKELDRVRVRGPLQRPPGEHDQQRSARAVVRD